MDTLPLEKLKTGNRALSLALLDGVSQLMVSASRLLRELDAHSELPPYEQKLLTGMAMNLDDTRLRTDGLRKVILSKDLKKREDGKS